MTDEYEDMWELMADYLESVRKNHNKTLVRRMLTFIRRRAPKNLKAPIRNALGDLNCAPKFQLSLMEVILIGAKEEAACAVIKAFCT